MFWLIDVGRAIKNGRAEDRDAADAYAAELVETVFAISDLLKGEK